MNETKTSATTIDSQELHPCGLTWEKWYWPFKMPEERRMVQEWLERKKHGEVFDESIPF